MEAAVVWLFNKLVPVRSRKLPSPNQTVIPAVGQTELSVL